ncbi:protein of unknown function (plasmid) [Shinella sp. WSC3-e]|nr:protein of unknown function [Shinella sp. WSC3-e]
MGRFAHPGVVQDALPRTPVSGGIMLKGIHLFLGQRWKGLGVEAPHGALLSRR